MIRTVSPSLTMVMSTAKCLEDIGDRENPLLPIANDRDIRAELRFQHLAAIPEVHAMRDQVRASQDFAPDHVRLN